MDLSMLVGTPMFAGSDGLLHGEDDCPNLVGGTVTPRQRPLSLDAELCDPCWGWAVAPEHAEVLDDFTELQDVDDAIQWARHKGLADKGFPSLLRALALLDDLSESGRGWADALRGEYVAEYRVERSRMVEAESPRPVRWYLRGEGLLVVDPSHVVMVLQSIPVEDLRLAARWWDPASSWPGYVCRAPLEVVEQLHARMERVLEGRWPAASYVALDPADPPEVEETARVLYDPGTVLGRVDRAFAAARAV